MMEVSNAFGSKLAQQKSDAAEKYEFYVKMEKLQSDFETNKQVAEINQKDKLFQMELEQNEKLGEQKRKQSEMDAEQKRLQNEEELRFLQRKQELMAAQEAKPKKMVQTTLDFFGKNKGDMKTYSELFLEVAKGTAPPETFGPTAKHVAELYEQTFTTQPVKLGRHHMYHKDHFDIIKKWTLEFELLLQFLQQKASC